MKISANLAKCTREVIKMIWVLCRCGATQARTGESVVVQPQSGEIREVAQLRSNGAYSEGGNLSLCRCGAANACDQT